MFSIHWFHPKLAVLNPDIIKIMQNVKVPNGKKEYCSFGRTAGSPLLDAEIKRNATALKDNARYLPGRPTHLPSKVTRITF